MGLREVKSLLKQVGNDRSYAVGEEWQDDQLGPHLVDPKLSMFWAEYFGISVKRFRDWREYAGASLRKGKANLPEKYQCAAATKRGTRCKKPVDVCGEPRSFFKGYSDTCTVHRRELVESEKLEFYQWLGVTNVESVEIPREPGMQSPLQMALDTSRFKVDAVRNQEISRQPWEHAEQEDHDPDEVDHDLFYAESRASFIEESLEVDLFLSLRRDLEEIKAKTSSNLGSPVTCKITHTRVNQTWTNDACGKLIRKLYVSKALGLGEKREEFDSRDDGSELQVELYHSKEDYKKRKMPFRICTIVSGQRMMVYGPRRSGGRKMFIVVRTTKLESSENRFYVNVEWWT
ncbi:MAG: hypothetical protein H6822_25990 [Planctomycetaceae bacterium]|nr:hypothetical protein [Planctomycetaceae bacterium]